MGFDTLAAVVRRIVKDNPLFEWLVLVVIKSVHHIRAHLIHEDVDYSPSRMNEDGLGEVYRVFTL